TRLESDPLDLGEERIVILRGRGAQLDLPLAPLAVDTAAKVARLDAVVHELGDHAAVLVEQLVRRAVVHDARERRQALLRPLRDLRHELLRHVVRQWPSQFDARAVHERALDVPPGVMAAHATTHRHTELRQSSVRGVQVTGVEVALLPLAHAHDARYPGPIRNRSPGLDVELFLDLHGALSGHDVSLLSEYPRTRPRLVTAGFVGCASRRPT